MIYVLKFLLIMLGFFSGLIMYYVNRQHSKFLNSEESEDLSLLNKIIIRLIAWILYLFFAGIISLCIYFVLSKITIG